ncbi:hypothetical protein Q7P35_005327 [Cladosporium inversicolor]
MSTPHTPTTAPQTSRLLSLPPELRNKIYDYALAGVQDDLCIDLEGRENKVHKEGDTKSRSIPTDDNTSRLSLLLTCRQINAEASGIAYSKMSMSFDTAFNTSDVTTHTAVTMIMDNFMQVFPVSKLGYITTMHVANPQVLMQMATLNRSMFDAERPTCSAKCASLSQYHGTTHDLFHKVKSIIIDGEEEGDGALGPLYELLPEGASWLTVTWGPEFVGYVLSVFSNLDKIVVRRECGEQVSKVVDGKIYAAESGMEMLDMNEYLRLRW